jgi:short-subunit dehydrogenase
MPFEGKNVVITGGAGGIGSLICKSFIEQGAKLTIVDRVSKHEVEGVVDLIQGDLSTQEGIFKVAETLRLQSVDVLINLAGLQYFGLLEDQQPEHLVKMYMVNLVAPALLTQAVLPAMKSLGHGHIVNIGSTFGSINFAHFVTYSSTKSGLKGFSEALRREVSDLGIHVTYVAPRAVKTPLNTEKVMQLAEMTKMHMDAPEVVAEKIVQAIVHKKKDAYIGFPESLFVRINAVMPRLVDRALAGNDKKARMLFN